MEEVVFHPLIARWLSETFPAPTAPQTLGWSAIAGGRDTLIAAPTGSGKTLAAFLWAINGLVDAASAGRLGDETSVIYVSPLKALGNDIQKNLQQPLGEIRRLARALRQDLPEIRVAVRSGDTPARERNLMIRRPPHILVTTPESLYLLLTAVRSREFLQTATTVIVDEIHAVAGDKRGAHLALSLERLDRLAGRRLQRIGLSATQKPIEEIARLLVGRGSLEVSTRTPPNPRLQTPSIRGRIDGAGGPDCQIVDVGHQRRWDLSIEVPGQPLGPIASHELWAEVYDRVAELTRRHRSSLVFVNTRRLVERVSHALAARLGEDRVAAHHGSLSRPLRLKAEQGLRSGEVPVVVATASLELGIDIGHVDLVCHLGAPRSLATLLQRVGRSGHWLGAVPKGILLPLTRDELVQSAAAVRAVRRGELDRVILPDKPLDVLVQQIVATAATEKLSEEALWEMASRAYPYRNLTRGEFEQVLEVASEGVSTRTGRRGSHVHRDQVNGMVSGRRGARLVAITCGGAIPDTADYDVIEDPEETFVGKVNEDFAVESMAGDIFLLGNTSWRIRRIESGRVRVVDAKGAPPTIPFWLGEAPARTAELSEAVSELRSWIASMLDDREEAIRRLGDEAGLDEAGAAQIVAYICETVQALGAVPSRTRVVAERFFDESGGMQLVLHAPFGARINRAWGLALRKRFCLSFDFELQAAATDDGIVLSLGEQHSFPLETVFSFLRSDRLEDVLVQAALVSPMFTNRWRWNATRALALRRHSGGRKVPMPIQRMRAEDLLGAVFPEQIACQDNHAGPIQPPDHPLVNETILNCLHEAMDLEGLEEVIGALERGEIETVAVETPAPSPASHEILNANPYAFLDDAPLEERRARAVALRRTAPALAAGMGALDQAAIAEVQAQAWPDLRDADEAHDFLLTVVLLPVEETGPWEGSLQELVSSGRVTAARWGRGRPTHREARAWVAAERLNMARAVLPDARFEPEIALPRREADSSPNADEALRAIVHGWMQHLGPITSPALAERLGLQEADVARSLLSLEGSGVVLRGRFTPGAQGVEWCERRLLARIHRLTLGRLRAEIEPVTPAQLMRFLLRWQHLQPGTQLHGREGASRVVAQLQGLELPAPAWEERVLPARIQRYDPSDLEYLCLSGTVAWGRLNEGAEVTEEEESAPPARPRRRPGPARNTPIGFLMREDLSLFVAARRSLDESLRPLSSAAREVAGHLERRGASFLSEIVKSTGRMPAEVEDALWELVSAGLVSGDGVAGLRLLLQVSRPSKRASTPTRLRALPAAGGRRRALPVGRWALYGQEIEPGAGLEHDQAIARQLLRRYGVVFRDLLARERAAPPWRVLLEVYRRLEAQGTIRGGRFVSGFVGEQFALPEAVEALRAVRRSGEDSQEVIVSAADPLNLVGIILPGARISPFSGLSIAYRNGVAIEVGPLGTIRSRLWSEARS